MKNQRWIILFTKATGYIIYMFFNVFNEMACSKAEQKMTVHINPKVVKVKEIKIEMKFQDFL